MVSHKDTHLFRRQRRHLIAQRISADYFHRLQFLFREIPAILGLQVDMHRPAAIVRQCQQRFIDPDPRSPLILRAIDRPKLHGISHQILHRPAAIQHLLHILPHPAGMLGGCHRKHRKFPVVRLRQTGHIVSRCRSTGASQDHRLTGLRCHAAGHIGRRPFIHARIQLKIRIPLHAPHEIYISSSWTDNDFSDMMLLQEIHQHLNVTLTTILPFFTHNNLLL